VRRPDLPLILIVLAVGVALALGVDDDPPPPADTGTEEVSADPSEAFLDQAGPALGACLVGDIRPREQPPEPPRSRSALIETVSRQVEELRELRFSEPVDADFLAPDELSDRVSELLSEEVPRRLTRQEGEILILLGAIPEGSDLYELQAEALGAQVIGLYVPELKELLVQSSGEPGPLELMTLSHELEHALADQRFGLRDIEASTAEADQALAYASVPEGDASLTMERYALAEIGLQAQLDAFDEEGVPGSQRQFDRLPDYLQRNLLFPYLGGLQIVCARWLKGGWAAVDRLYDDPPQGTDEILFPGRYGDGPPEVTRNPGRPAHPWELITERELGAAELEWLFSAPGGETEAALPEPRRLVAAWAGGEVELWGAGGERAIGISLLEQPEADLLCGAMAAWYRATRPQAVSERTTEGEAETIAFSEPGREAVISCSGDEVRLGIAPGETVASDLAG
jgi:hypothetical protein